jgi:hypothetical protein
MIDNSEDGGTRAGEFVAFAGTRRIAAGPLADAACAAWRALQSDGATVVLVFNAVNGRVVDLDLRGTETDILARYAPSAVPTPPRGRPKLGVVAREVTLLPRHWAWLAGQPGGASAVLRRLVETARKAGGVEDAARKRAEAAYRFMSAVAGDRPGFEDAARDLFAGDRNGLRDRIRRWPGDIQAMVFDLLREDKETATPDELGQGASPTVKRLVGTTD